MRVRVRERPDRQNLQLVYTDPMTGRSKTRSAGTSDWKAAERAAAKWEAELDSGGGFAATSWDVFRTRFEDEYLPEKRPSTRREYMTALNHFEAVIGSPRDVNAINASVVSRFRAELRKRVASEETVKKILRHLRAALNWAGQIEMIARPPTIKIKTLKKSLRGRPITVFEFVRMYHQAESDQWRDLMLAIWLSGLRLEEAMRLSFSPPVQLDLDQKYPRIRFQVEGHKAARDELVPLTPAMTRFVRRFTDRTDGPLFPVPVLLNEVSARISDYGEAAGVRVSPTKFASAQDMRRSFGSRWALRVHPFVLKQMMRHRSLETTLAYYADIDTDEIAAHIWGDVHGAVHGARPDAGSGRFRKH